MKLPAHRFCIGEEWTDCLLGQHKKNRKHTPVLGKKENQCKQTMQENHHELWHTLKQQWKVVQNDVKRKSWNLIFQNSEHVIS